MELNKKMELLEEVLDVEEGVLNTDTILEDLDEWDSVAVLSLIIMFEENFNKKITGEQAKSFKTVNDILNLMY